MREDGQWRLAGIHFAFVAGQHHPRFQDTTVELLRMFALLFGIPLSFLALLTGIGPAPGSRWGLFRYAWVIAKLMPIVSVIVVGAVVYRPLLFGSGTSDVALVAGASWRVATLTVGTAFSVFKSGARLGSDRDGS